MASLTRAPTKYDRYIVHVIEYWQAHKDQRRGQAYFNALTEFDLDTAQAISRTPLDPFYGDEVLGDFRAWLRARWEISGGHFG